jgi:hypothetical protein
MHTREVPLIRTWNTHINQQDQALENFNIKTLLYAGIEWNQVEAANFLISPLGSFTQSWCWQCLYCCISILLMLIVQTYHIIICLLHKICHNSGSNKLSFFFWLLAGIISTQPCKGPDPEHVTLQLLSLQIHMYLQLFGNMRPGIHSDQMFFMHNIVIMLLQML